MNASSYIPNFPYYNTVDQIFHAEWSIPKLARTELVRQSVATLWPDGHPTRFLHVVGTSGKGSTSRFLETGFGCIGNAGAFMSPHLFDYRERFSINGQFASQQDIHWAWEKRIKPHCLQVTSHNPHNVLSFHEISILIALTLFEKYEVAWAAIEASVGGRYDQACGLDCVATVLTNVGTDHANFLGSEHWQRVLDKAGAVRPGALLFTADPEPETLAIIQAVCDDVGSPMHSIGQTDVAALTAHLADAAIAVHAESLLHAEYQKWNAALARAVVQHFCPEVDDKRLLQAFADARLLGRFWRVDDHTYADIAHNIEKVGALAGEIDQQFGDRGKILVLGVSGQRAPAQLFASLAGSARAIIFTGAPYKGQDPGQVQRQLAALTAGIPTLVIADPRAAVEMAHTLRQGDEVVILTGSTYMIEQALNPDPQLRHLSATFGWRTQTDNEATGTVRLSLPKTQAGVR